ncbi:MAG: hypothetical protein ACTSR3_02300 [Candidatus Helarchaeota archaeon]
MKSRYSKVDVIYENEKFRKFGVTKQDIINSLDKDLIKIFDSITQYRNDINHASFRPNSYKPVDLKKRL